MCDIIGSQRNTIADGFDRKEVNTMAITIIRQIDTIGRIVIPKDLREQYGIKPGEKLYFEAYDNGILIHREGYAYGNDEQNDKNSR